MIDKNFNRRLARHGISAAEWEIIRKFNPARAAMIEFALQPVDPHTNPNHPRRLRKRLGLSPRQYRMRKKTVRRSIQEMSQ